MLAPLRCFAVLRIVLLQFPLDPFSDGFDRETPRPFTGANLTTRTPSIAEGRRHAIAQWRADPGPRLTPLSSAMKTEPSRCIRRRASQRSHLRSTVKPDGSSSRMSTCDPGQRGPKASVAPTMAAVRVVYSPVSNNGGEYAQPKIKEVTTSPAKLATAASTHRRPFIKEAPSA